MKLDYVVDNQAGQARNARIELRSEVGGVVQNPQPQTGSLAESVWHLRLTRSGDTFTGAYSADGETWTTFDESVTNAPAADAKVGLFALGAWPTPAPGVLRPLPGGRGRGRADRRHHHRGDALHGRKVFVAVRAANDDTVPLAITLETPYGSKQVADVAPGANAYQSFASRAVAVDAGTVTVTATDAEGRTFSGTADYAARSCS